LHLNIWQVWIKSKLQKLEDKDIDRIINILKKEALYRDTPAVTETASKTRDPFKVLISCLLSLRTKDEVTRKASQELFSRAADVKSMVKLPTDEIQKIIYPVGFYRNKARSIKRVCKTLIERYRGKVPSELDELLSLPGVGRKTANLVLTLGFGKPGICVDTHVHRITNRWGYVTTKNPEETELALRKKLPLSYWIQFNSLLVSFGQRVCKPLSPFCSRCPVRKFCRRVGVKRSR